MNPVTEEQKEMLIECAAELVMLVPNNRKAQALGVANELLLFLERLQCQ